MEKLNSEGTSKGRHVFVKNNFMLKNKLKWPLRKHDRSNSLLKTPLQLYTKRPLKESTGRIQKEWWIRNLTSEPSGDFDEEFTEEGASTRNTKRDEALLKELRENENDSDSEKSIVGDSDEDERETNSSLSRVSGLSITKAYDVNKGDLVLVRDEGSHADDKDNPINDENETQQENDDPEATTSRKNDDDEYREDEDEEPDDEEIEDRVKQRHKMKPLEITDQTSQAIMPKSEEKQDQINAFVDREQRLQALREFSTQMKQQMLQRLRLSYENTMAQKNVQLPSQYFKPQAWRQYSEAPFNAPVFIVPAAPIYRLAAFIGPPSSASLPTQTDHHGYTINVDGLKGVFSKEPGYVLRFHSPNSEVTVVKKKNVVADANEYKSSVAIAQ